MNKNTFEFKIELLMHPIPGGLVIESSQNEGPTTLDYQVNVLSLSQILITSPYVGSTSHPGCQSYLAGHETFLGF